MIYISKMVDEGVQTLFEKGTCKMVKVEMVLVRGIRVGTMYLRNWEGLILMSVIVQLFLRMKPMGVPLIL